MKRLVVLLLLTFGFLAMPSRAEVELSFDFFHDELSPMGEWAEVDGYGYVWHPSGVDEDWSPYSDGYWSYTDAGWTWVSYEDWGGITYHYGRWTRVNDYGWCWVPGYKWGPAWVSWRKSEDYVGWAPLPPECDWDEDRGVGVWVDSTYEIGPSYYSFCHTRDFGAPVIRAVLLPRIRNVDICFGTVNITAISYNRDYGCAFNGGFDYDWIRARCHRPVPALKLVQNTTNIYINGNRGNVFVNSPRGNALIVAAPRVANRTNFNVATRQVAVNRRFQRTAVTKGWAGLEKDVTRDRLLGKMREETKGLNRDNTPARRVRPEELAVVPKTADFKARPAALTKIPEERRNPALANQGDPAIDRKDRDSRPNRLDRDGDGRPDASRGGSTEGGGVLPPGRENGRGKVGERPAAAQEKPVATTEDKEPAGGLRRRPGREGAQADTDGPDRKPGSARPQQPGGAPIVDQPGADADKPGRRVNPRTADAASDNDSVEKPRAAQRERAGQNEKRAAEMQRENGQEKAAQQNAQRERANEVEAARRANAQQAENAERAQAQRAQAQREAAQENARRARGQESDNAERAQAQRAQAQREAAQENARREAAQDNARREAAQDNARREAAQDNARREAAQQQQENQRRMMQERQQNNQRQENAQRQRGAAVQEQQAEARARAAAANRERAMDAQRQQAAEANRARAMENQQRAAQAQAQQRAAMQQQRAAQYQAPQRVQPPPQQRPQQGGNGRSKGKKGEEQ